MGLLIASKGTLETFILEGLSRRPGDVMWLFWLPLFEKTHFPSYASDSGRPGGVITVDTSCTLWFLKRHLPLCLFPERFYRKPALCAEGLVRASVIWQPGAATKSRVLVSGQRVRGRREAGLSLPHRRRIPEAEPRKGRNRLLLRSQKQPCPW